MNIPWPAAEPDEVIQWCKDNEIRGRLHLVQGRLMLEIPDPVQQMFFLLRWGR